LLGFVWCQTECGGVEYFRPSGVVQWLVPSGSRVLLNPPPSLARWWCLHFTSRVRWSVAPPVGWPGR